MKFVSVREAKAQFSECIEQAQKDTVVITKHGTPRALIIGADGKGLEDLVTVNDKAFWGMIRKSRKQRTHSLAEVEKKLGLVGRAPRRRIRSR